MAFNIPNYGPDYALSVAWAYGGLKYVKFVDPAKSRAALQTHSLIIHSITHGINNFVLNY